MSTTRFSARRRAALLEIAVVGTAVGTFSWRVAGDPRVIPWAPLVIAALLVFVVYVGAISPRLFGDSLAVRGLGPRRDGFLRRDDFKRSLAAYSGLTFTCGIVIVAAALYRRPDAIASVNAGVFVRKLVAYCSSGLFQQLIFGAWFCVRLTTLFAPDAHDVARPAGDVPSAAVTWRVCAAAAIGSALFHLPNAPLVAISTVLACGFAWAQLRMPNLALAALSHAVLGTLLHQLAGISMRIGPFHERPERHFFRELLPFLQTWMQDVR
jgi:hypothetical protein